MGETRLPDEKKLVADVVVVGAGPAGLMAALLLAEEGKRVILIEKRGRDFIRPQLVALDYKTIDTLKILELRDPEKLREENEEEALREDNFQKQLKNPVGYSAIKDVQRHLQRRIDEHKNILCMFDTSLEKTDMEEGYISVATPDKNFKILWTNLIAADGGSRHTVNLVNKDLIEKDKDPIEFVETHDSVHKNFISRYLKVTKKNGEPIEMPRALDQYESKQGLDVVNYHLTSLNKSEFKQLKFSVTSCISDDDYKKFKEDKEAGLKHAIEIAKKSFPSSEFEITPVKESKKHGVAKDNLKYQVFQRIFQEAKTAGIEINNHYFCLIGDAYKNPDLYQGIGANSAILHAVYVVGLLTNRLTLEKFNQLSKKMGQEQLETTQSIERVLHQQTNLIILTETFINSLIFNLDKKTNELKKKQAQGRLYQLTGLSNYAADIKKLEEVKNILIEYPIYELDNQLEQLEQPDTKRKSFCPQLFKPVVSPETKEHIKSIRKDVSNHIMELKDKITKRILGESEDKEFKEVKKPEKTGITRRKSVS